MKYFFLPVRAAAALVGVVAVFTVATAFGQTDPTTVRLTYPDANGDVCRFITNGGISISGAQAQYVDAVGHFDDASNCPVGGGDGIDLGQISMTVKDAGGSAAGGTLETALHVDEGDNVTINWGAVGADACRFDGSSLPGTVNGWSGSGYACIGENACGGPNNLGRALATAGNYKFQLVCVDKENPTVTRTATRYVVVEGEEPPVDTSCTSAPVGLSRVVIGDVSNSAGNRTRKNIDAKSFDEVYGYDIINPTTKPQKTWPGYHLNTLKFGMSKTSFWAMQFDVPSDYPVSGAGQGPGGGFGPYGKFSTNDTLTDAGYYTMSISTKCGDFPTMAEYNAKTPEEKRCYAEYQMLQGSGLQWEVKPSGQFAATSCTLRAGQPYFFNITPGRLGDPLNQQSGACNKSSCRVNIAHDGNF